MTKIEQLQDCLEYFINQSSDIMTYRREWGNLVARHGMEFQILLDELKNRNFMANKPTLPSGYRLEITDDGKNFYNNGGFIEENNNKKEFAELELQLKKYQVNSLKPYRFWLPLGIASLALILNFFQWNKTKALEKELQNTNLKLDTLKVVSDSHSLQYKETRHKLSPTP